jgi:hypothetical protein
MPRRKQPSMQVQAFRLSVDLMKRLDRHAERLRAEHPGLKVTRADALRLLLNEALDAKEGNHGKA